MTAEGPGHAVDSDGPSAITVDLLLHEALSRPGIALDAANGILAASDDPSIRSVALQAIGIIHRDRGDVPLAAQQLRSALRMARRSGSSDRVADVMATLGATLAKDGQTTAGLRQLDEAVLIARGETLARVQMRRAHVRSMLGGHAEALADLRLAIKGIRRAKDPVWEARALNNRCLVHLAVGAVGRADLDSRRAERLFLAAGQQLEAVHVLHNRGIIAQSKGDPTGALRLLETAAVRYAELVGPSPELAIDRCRLLLDLGLTSDAVAIIEQALRAPNVSSSMKPELMLTAAGAALAAGDAQSAQTRAAMAAKIFTRQQRPWWVARTTLVAAQAAFAAGKRDRRLLTTVDSLAATLDQLHADESAAAHLLAGRLAAIRRDESSRRHFEAAARHRLHGSSLSRAAGWLAQALLHEVEGRPRGVLASCSRGLDALDEHRLTLGSSELRALASSHGAGLAELAIQQVAARPGARALLVWTERVRSSALTMPLVRPPPSSHGVAQMAAYREATRRLEQARARGENVDRPLRARDRAEAAIRRDRHQIGGRSADRRPVDVDALRGQLGETRLVEIAQVDGILHAVVLSASPDHPPRSRTARKRHQGNEIRPVRSAARRCRTPGRPCPVGRPTPASAAGYRGVGTRRRPRRHRTTSQIALQSLESAARACRPGDQHFAVVCALASVAASGAATRRRHRADRRTGINRWVRRDRRVARTAINDGHSARRDGNR